MHGGADPLGQVQLGCLLILPRRQRFTAGKQLPLQHHRLVIHHLTCVFSVTGRCRRVAKSEVKKKKKRLKARTLATTTSEDAALDKFQFCSLLGAPSHQLKSPACPPTESTNTETLLVSAPSLFQATQV